MRLTICHRHELDPATMDALVRLAMAVRDNLNQGKEIMSKIADFAAAVGTSLDAITSGLDTLGNEVKALQDDITALQNSTGTITPDDQALLDSIQTRAATIATTVQGLDAAAALPAATPAPGP